ncbi:MAG TPA: DUF4910 domain-containing protein [Bryobacteraceae bacterium]|nr:DUF4910 domain-containing protein [Bryobacteraceae bacterium]
MLTLRILLCFALCATGQQVRFHTIPDAVVEGRLERIGKDNAERAERLAALFQEAGCGEPNLAREKAKGSKLPNITCVLTAGPEAEVIVVSAHYDKVRAGAGALDNWSGAALLPSLYQSVAGSQDRKYTYLFIGFSDEEAGLIGAKAWVAENRKGMLPRVRALVNLDCIGAGPLYLWDTRADKELGNVARRIGASISYPIHGVSADAVGDSDATPFRLQKIPTIDFHSLDNEKILILHTIDDQLSVVDREHYRKSYRFLAIYLRYLDQLLAPRKQ